ncbi:MAG: TraE/TraK family type IV conjugative transfer system protein [Syntrophaceae bacterium]
MKHIKYLSQFEKIKASNKVLMLIVFLIGALVVINTFVTISISAKEKIILVPAGLQTKAEIYESKANEQYLTAFTRYALGLLLNYNPATVKQQYEELLLLYDVASYPVVRTQLFNLVDTVKTSQISSVFIPQKFVVDQGNSWIKVQGTRKIYKDDRTSANTLQNYQITYKIYDSKFSIIDIKEVESL